jgi:single-strand DNA-binding protein
MNHITLEGGLPRDAEMKYTQAGKAILNFSVACTDGSGEYTKTSYFDCTIFGKFAEAIVQYLNKGCKVVCFGRMEQRKYTDKDGNNRTAWSVMVDNLRMVGGKKTEQEAPEVAQDDAAYEPGEPPPDDVDDPFA